MPPDELAERLAPAHGFDAHVVGLAALARRVVVAERVGDGQADLEIARQRVGRQLRDDRVRPAHQHAQLLLAGVDVQARCIGAPPRA